MDSDLGFEFRITFWIQLLVSDSRFRLWAQILDSESGFRFGNPIPDSEFGVRSDSGLILFVIFYVPDSSSHLRQREAVATVVWSF